MCAHLPRAHRSLLNSLLFAVHSRRGIIDFLSLTLSLVSEYSTRGGISAKDSLFINPSVCRSFSISERVFGPIPFSVSIILLNLSFSQLPRMLMMRSVHFLLIMSMMSLMGQMQVCSSFLVNEIALILGSYLITMN